MGIIADCDFDKFDVQDAFDLLDRVAYGILFAWVMAVRPVYPSRSAGSTPLANC